MEQIGGPVYPEALNFLLKSSGDALRHRPEDFLGLVVVNHPKRSRYCLFLIFRVVLKIGNPPLYFVWISYKNTRQECDDGGSGTTFFKPAVLGHEPYSRNQQVRSWMLIVVCQPFFHLVSGGNLLGSANQLRATLSSWPRDRECAEDSNENRPL